MRLNEISAGMTIDGLLPDQSVSIIEVKIFNDIASEITYKKRDGSLDHQLLYVNDAESCSIAGNNNKSDFSGDGHIFQLVSEAERIRLAYLFDPYLAVHTSSIEPLPHQITAVYEQMLPKHPLRYVLADDPGAGKTIMTGLLLKELIIREDVQRCIIVSPGNLVEQWQDELHQKFNLRFEILTNDMLENTISGNAFQEHPLLIARLDKLSRNEELHAKIKATEWDLIVVDEAHKLSATVQGNVIKQTKRYKLGKLLSTRTRHFLLLTATPHNGKEADFRQFMALVDDDRFQCHASNIKKSTDISGVMRRLVKEELVKFDGTPLFPERLATTIPYSLSMQEQALYDHVTEYVRDQFNRADRLQNDKKQAVGFALTVLQRRLASSPEAIYQSLHRRKERLEKKINNLPIQNDTLLFQPNEDIWDDLEDLPEEEAIFYENGLLDNATAASTIEELQAEISILAQLEQEAELLRRSHVDKKWEQVSKLLQSPQMINDEGRREKIIIFTEHRDTLRYLAIKIRTLLGKQEAVVTIQGGMHRDERKKVEQLFKQDADTAVLVATDAAGEGINLQRAHFMINYDLPWNPNRIEQRFGRIHRIGQTEICHLWNLVAKDTREGQVFDRLFAKLNQEKESLGGKVFDVLGKLTFGDRPLRDILVEAIRYGNDPANRAKLNSIVDSTLNNEYLLSLINEHALTNEILDQTTVNRIKEDMERTNARRLQPHYIQAFFEQAFSLAGGLFHSREKGRYEITRVPQIVQESKVPTSKGQQVLRKYERICFTQEGINVAGKPIADMICPGHPLLDSLISWTISSYAKSLETGTILLDSTGRTDIPFLLFEVETAMRDARRDQERERIISRGLSYVKIDKQKETSSCGYAPYLDYESVPAHLAEKAHTFLASQNWVNADTRNEILSYVIASVIPPDLERIKQERTLLIEKISHEVDSRLRAEIAYWDKKAGDYATQIRQGNVQQSTKNNLEYAKDKANELDGRRMRRLEELQQEKIITSLPPVIRSMAFVIPSHLLQSNGFEVGETKLAYGMDRKTIELKAMQAVISIEKKLGFVPRDVSEFNVGYDIESLVPTELRGKTQESLRFIEVKGRCKDHEDYVTISRNEILTALNTPDQYILALVTVQGEKTVTTYCQRSFTRLPEEAINCSTFNVAKLIGQSAIIYDERG